MSVFLLLYNFALIGLSLSLEVCFGVAYLRIRLRGSFLPTSRSTVGVYVLEVER